MKDVYLTKKDKETLRRLERLSPAEALRATGCKVKEIKTLHGDIVTIEDTLALWGKVNEYRGLLHETEMLKHRIECERKRRS